MGLTASDVGTALRGTKAGGRGSRGCRETEQGCWLPGLGWGYVPLRREDKRWAPCGLPGLFVPRDEAERRPSGQDLLGKGERAPAVGGGLGCMLRAPGGQPQPLGW